MIPSEAAQIRSDSVEQPALSGALSDKMNPLIRVGTSCPKQLM